MIVDARGLSRTYVVHESGSGLWGSVRALFSSRARTVRAVHELDLQVEPGAFVGVVGPNGAGKSTTLKMLTGILEPSGGTVEVCGVEPHRNRRALARRIGVVFGQRTQLWWDLSAAEGFRLLRHIYDVDDATFERRLATLTERLQLGDWVGAPVRKLSLGQKMRCELCAALLHGPELLFLDEPTIGLDVVVKDELHRFLRELNRTQGTTILLTSHDLDDIERLCRRVVVVDGGRVVHDGDLASLLTTHGHMRRLTVHLASPEAPPDIDGAQIEATAPRTWVLTFDADQVDAPWLVRRVMEAHDVVDLTLHESSIEEVLKRIYR